MKNAIKVVSVFLLVMFCTANVHAQTNGLSVDQRFQMKKALMQGEHPTFQSEFNIPFTNTSRFKTENYTRHLTPRNTGDNELSTFYINNVFIDSQGRYYFQSGSYTNYALDVYDSNDGSWSHLEVGEDLPGRVTSFAEVSESQVWVGTNDGLYKYNSDYVLEDSLDLNTDSMPSNIISGLYYDCNGHMWAVQNSYYNTNYNFDTGSWDTTYVNGGLTLFDPADKSIIARSDTMNFELEEIITKHGIRDFAEGPDGDIWATTAVGHAIAVFKSDGSSATALTASNSDLPDNSVIYVENGGDGSMWVSFGSDSTKVLGNYDGTNWTTYGVNDLPFSYCGAMTVGSGNQLYCSDDGVYSYDGTDWTEFTDVTIKGESLENAAFISSNNGVDIFRPAGPGVFIKEGDNWDYLSTHTDNGLFSMVVFGASTDDQNGLWTSGFYGTSYFDGTDWTYYDESDGLADPYSWKIHAASDGTVWFGSTDSVSYLKDGEFRTVEEYTGFFGEDVYEDRDGNIWLGSYTSNYEDPNYSDSPGILMYDGTDFTLFPSDSSTVGYINLSFAHGPDDMMYATTMGVSSENNAGYRHLIRYDGSAWSVWNPDSSISVGYTKLEVDNDNNLYFLGSDTSNTNFLYKWDGENLSNHEVPEPCSSGTEAMEADEENNIWIDCYSTVAIFNVDEESWVTHEIPSGGIYDIKHDGSGTTWVATYTTGLFEFNTAQAVSNEEFADATPKAFKLNQNYPNPFNPNTIISYQLPENSRVTLKVYDLLGREVATLVNNETQTSGQHQVNFDAKSLASGMYIYRLKSKGFTATRKMMLIK